MWRAVRLAAALIALVTTIACTSATHDDQAPPNLYFALFELYSSKLQPETRDVLVQAATGAKSGERVVIRIVSAHDSISITAYTKSQHRQAEVVERELIALGIPTGDIEIAIHPEPEPPPPPEPGSVVIYGQA